MGENSRFGNILFETAMIAAGTGTSTGLDDHMTGLSGCTGQSCIQMMIQNDSRTDTCMYTDMDQIFMIFHKGFFCKGRKICFIFQPYRNLQSVFQSIFDGKVCKIIIWSEGNFIPADGTVDTNTDSHNTKGGGWKKTDLILNELQQEINRSIPFQRAVILMKPTVLSQQITDHQHSTFHTQVQGDNITVLTAKL